MAPKAPPDRDRLQPALLDRLIADESELAALAAETQAQPGTEDTPSDAASARAPRAATDVPRALTRQQLRAAVLRDLTWLLNAVQPSATAREHPSNPDTVDGIDEERYPHVAASTLNYGLPPLSGSQASQLDIATLEQNVRQAILRFEPRILPDTLRVRALEDIGGLDRHNQIALEITGLLWSQPVPLEILIRTELDLETGQVHVRDPFGTMAAS